MFKKINHNKHRKRGIFGGEKKTHFAVEGQMKPNFWTEGCSSDTGCALTMSHI